MLNGVFWRTRYGLPWRDLPPQYRNWKTVYNRHRRWSSDGTWARLLDELRRDADNRYDKRNDMFRGTIDVASIRIWLRDPSHDPRDTL